MQGHAPQGTEGGLIPPVVSHDGTPEASRVNATRSVTWHADTRDNDPAESPTSHRQRQLSLRRRSSLDSVLVDGRGSPVEGGRTPREGSDFDFPMRQITDSDDADDTCEVRALLITLDGGSLWVPCPSNSYGLTISTLPSGVRPRSSVPDIGHLSRVLHQLGVPLSAYERHGGRHHYPPIR